MEYVECDKERTKSLIQDVRKAISSAITSNEKRFIILPQGTGKTYNALEVALEKYGAKGVYFISPTKANIADYRNKFSRFFTTVDFNAVHTSVIWLETNVEGANGRVVSETKIKSLVARLKFQGVKVIIVDECHELTSDCYGLAIKELIKHWDLSVLGLSPYFIRLTIGLTLEERLWWKGVFNPQPIFAIDYDTAWKTGVLAFPYVQSAIVKNKAEIYEQIQDTIEESNVALPKHKINDYIRDKYSTAFSKFTISGALQKVSDNVSTFPDSNHFVNSNEQLIFWLFSKDLNKGADDCIFNKDCKNLQEQLSSYYNISEDEVAVYKVHSYVKSVDDAVDSYNKDKKSKIKILASVDMVSKGIHPDSLTATVLCRHTESTEYLLQMCLRESHIHYTKQPVIIDVVDTTGYINCIQNPTGVKPKRDIQKYNEIEKMLVTGRFEMLDTYIRESLDIAVEYKDNSLDFFNESVKLARVLTSDVKTKIVSKYLLFERFYTKSRKLKFDYLCELVASELNEDYSVVKAVIKLSKVA